MRRRLVVHVASTALFAATVLAAGLPATAAPAATESAPAATAPRSTTPTITAALAGAMQRDLGLTRAQVDQRLAQEAAATQAEHIAEQALGAGYAGSWFDAASGRLVVHTTGTASTAKAGGLRGVDVEIRTAEHSLAELTGVKNAIDALAGRAAPAGVNGWYVDVPSNSVVLSVNPTKADAATTDFVARAVALSGGSARVTESADSPRTYADIVGAYPYFINNSSRCSIGFAVSTGFVSAGHCGAVGDSATDVEDAALGTFAGSVFPGAGDYSYVRAAAGASPYGYVYGYDGYYYYVYGSAEAVVGASICRSGATTGMWCGTVQAKDQTVNYAQGAVTGLTQTNVCAEPGDSGGSWISANQAQGVTSGGSGNCTSGGTTFFQPVNEILSAYGLTLLTTG
ncbi:S1 family peptidase [Goodfellowiella coeruleoviolacea]|uniref:Streptogrisin C n=1 Tax=Goodfellowiella coeruleoviolacea TaxID=334858 RepID=A0AAE3G9H0_9PSEU|nr:S1 family peptidase [Goodfellowiella coeruleoviolacea]MCP2164132.1 streptogrisin C [Goodfellowiella coeruleoviolacea]